MTRYNWRVSRSTRFERRRLIQSNNIWLWQGRQPNNGWLGCLSYLFSSSSCRALELGANVPFLTDVVSDRAVGSQRPSEREGLIDPRVLEMTIAPKMEPIWSDSPAALAKETFLRVLLLGAPRRSAKR